MPASLPPPEDLPFPLRIGLIADTHLVDPRRWLRPEVLLGLDQCDLIFHAGDISRPWVLARLAGIAPVRAVQGNNDAGFGAELPMEMRFRCGPHRIALIHGHWPVLRKRQTARSLVVEYLNGVVDCAVYGHSHRPENAWRDGLLLVNPGSATWPRWEPAPSYGILRVAETMEATIVPI